MRFSPNEYDDVLDGCSGLQMISSVRFGILPVRIKVVGQERDQRRTNQRAPPPFCQLRVRNHAFLRARDSLFRKTASSLLNAYFRFITPELTANKLFSGQRVSLGKLSGVGCRTTAGVRDEGIAFEYGPVAPSACFEGALCLLGRVIV